MDTNNEQMIIHNVSNDFIIINRKELLDFLKEYKNRIRANEAGINTNEWDWSDNSLKIKLLLGI